ncbi:MAG TPA: hypothetical protein VGQ99_23055 [Tepidisphaeraceae bacterium]|jgi:hypothetical protein|nr:hypothetical protein [Tepidisphaeraceae bacterium]
MNTKKKTSCDFVSFVDNPLRAASWMPRAILYLLSSILFLAAGCKSAPSSQPRSGAPAANPGLHSNAADLSPLDPCPERLHDIAGALLNFLVQYNHLPPTLEDLPPIKGGAPVLLTCPLSNQKYIYNPDGIKFPPNRWAIVYDPAPSHSNYRWAIVFSQSSQPGAAPIPSVLAIPESEFKAATEFFTR